MQANVLLLDELPLFDFLRDARLFQGLADIFSAIGSHYRRNFMDELADVKDVIASLKSLAAADTVRALSLPSAMDKVARAERWTHHAEAAAIPGRRRSDKAVRIASAKIVLDAVARLALEVVHPLKSAKALTWFGIKMPGLVDVADVMRLVGITDKFLMVSTFRDPTRTCHSSMKRHADTLAGKDRWHITSVQQAIEEWIHNFYYQKFWFDRLGDDFYHPAYYENLGESEQYDMLGLKLGMRIEKPDYFCELSSYVEDLDPSIPTEITERVVRARLPSSAAWQRLIRGRKGGADLFRTEPVLQTDREWIDMSVADPAIIYLGYGAEEPDGRWITSEACRLHFWSPIHTEADRIRVEISALPAMSGLSNMVKFSFNGSDAVRVWINTDGTFSSSQEDVVLEDRALTFKVSMREWNTLDIECERTFQIGSDPRSLAFKVGSITPIRREGVATQAGVGNFHPQVPSDDDATETA